MAARILRNKPQWLAAILVAFLLVSCSFAGNITGMSLDYNSAIEEHDNSELVVNILRARDDVPLAFSDLSQIRGSLQATGSLQSNWPFGPLRASTARGTEQATLSLQMSPTFDISPLNATIFTNAIQQPIALKTIAQIQDSNFISDAVLLNLFIGSIDEKNPDGTITVYTNNPCPDQRCSEYGVWQLFVQKLSRLANPNDTSDLQTSRRIVFHAYKELTAVGLPTTSVALKDIPTGSDAAMETKIKSGKIQAYKVAQKVAVCLLTQKAASDKPIVIVTPVIRLDSNDPGCEQAEIEKETAKSKSVSGKYTFHPRSIRGIFDYLGHLLLTPLDQRPIFFDIRETPYADNWIATSYRGRIYYVATPRSNELSSQTPHVLQILTQLLNASRSASEIATTKATQSVP